ncbi:MAG: trypsin-like serine protease [Rhizobiaceae bacterium]|nr:trypsin-like serine protease [Rhizobiaceae bacterium]
MKAMHVLVAASATAAWIGAAVAADNSAGSEGTGEVPRAAAVVDYEPKGGKQNVPSIDESARAAPLTDEAALVGTMAAVGRSADGRDLRVDPSESLRDAVRADLSGGSEGQSGKPEADRKVFGKDERVQVTNTKVQPFKTIGYIETVTSKGEVFRCSGTLIGPHTVMTAAHCLYNHHTGGWYNEYYFVPGMVDIKTYPFGVYASAEVYIVEGYITQYQGNDGSTLPWDLGVMILSDPIGDSLGWMAYQNYNTLGDFEATTAGYPGDKPNATMWRTTCDVSAEMVDTDNFFHHCDSSGGASGSSMWIVDQNNKRQAVGVLIAESDVDNASLRINATYKQWLNDLNR